MKDQIEEAAKYTSSQLTYSVDRAYDRGVEAANKETKEKVEKLLKKWEKEKYEHHAAKEYPKQFRAAKDIDDLRALLESLS